MFCIINRYSNPVRWIPSIVRNISTYPEDTAERLTVTDDGKMIVCWHPEKSFPYECSKPLPPEKLKSSSLLNMSAEEVYQTFKNKDVRIVREELAKLTYTCVHGWYPRSRDRKAKKTPMNRPYL